MLRSPTNLIHYLPPIFKDKKEYIQICETENSEFDLLFSNINSIYRNQFLFDLDINGVKRWEKIMKITPKQSETLDDRRFRIQTRYLTKLPYTMRSLYNILDTLCGRNGYKVELDSDQLILKVRLELTVKNQLDEVKRTLRRIVPTNIVLDIDLLYNQYQTVGKYTYEHLSKFTYEQIREEALSNERNGKL